MTRAERYATSRRLASAEMAMKVIMEEARD